MLSLSALFLVGCGQKALTNNIYPDENAKVGEQYGAMTVSAVPTEENPIYMSFTGEVSISGEYSYSGEGASFGENQFCFSIIDTEEMKKLPKSEYFKDTTGKNFCLTNTDKAKELLDEYGSATITINAFQDNIKTESEVPSMATLVSVESKTEAQK